MALLFRSAPMAAARSAVVRSRILLSKPAPSRSATSILRRSIVPVLGNLESLMPLHSAIASARLKSFIAVDSSCWSWLSQESRSFFKSLIQVNSKLVSFITTRIVPTLVAILCKFHQEGLLIGDITNLSVFDGTNWHKMNHAMLDRNSIQDRLLRNRWLMALREGCREAGLVTRDIRMDPSGLAMGSSR